MLIEYFFYPSLILIVVSWTTLSTLNTTLFQEQIHIGKYRLNLSKKHNSLVIILTADLIWTIHNFIGVSLSWFRYKNILLKTQLYNIDYVLSNISTKIFRFTYLTIKVFSIDGWTKCCTNISQWWISKETNNIHRCCIQIVWNFQTKIWWF